MSTTEAAAVGPYEAYMKHFKGANGIVYDRRNLARNTYLEHRGEGEGHDLAVVLHETDVVTIHADDTFTLRTGGYFTATTKDRINLILNDYGLLLYQEKRVWYITRRRESDGLRFFDGMHIDRDLNVLNREDAPDLEGVDAHNSEVQRLIRRYIDGLKPETVARVCREEGRGDCLMCLAEANGTPWPGEASEHLMSHLEERYYMPSLFFNAIRARKFPNPALIMHMVALAADRGKVDSLLTDSLRPYFRSRLLREVASG